MDRIPPAPARRGTTPIQPTGEVRPAPASRAAIRRANRAGANAPARTPANARDKGSLR